MGFKVKEIIKMAKNKIDIKYEVFNRDDYQTSIEFAKDIVVFSRKLRNQKITFEKIGSAHANSKEVVFIYQQKQKEVI